MKKKFLIVSVLLILIGGFIMIIANHNHNKIYRAVRNFVAQHSERQITLGELTSFDWDLVLYFYYTNPQEIYNVIGVNFTETDLTTGLLFVKDQKIVYCEFFPQKARRIDSYPVKFMMQNVDQKHKIFHRDDLFELGMTKDAFGNQLYFLNPVLFE